MKLLGRLVLFLGITLPCFCMASSFTLTTTEARQMRGNGHKFSSDFASTIHSTNNGRKTDPINSKSFLSLEIIGEGMVRVEIDEPEESVVEVPAEIHIKRGKVESIEIPRSSVKKIFKTRMLVSSFDLLRSAGIEEELEKIEIDAQSLICLKAADGLSCTQKFSLSF